MYMDRPIEIKYWDHFPEDIGGKLSSRHRLAVAEVVDEFDFFISIEGAKKSANVVNPNEKNATQMPIKIYVYIYMSTIDDIHLTSLMFDAFVDASNRLALADEKDRCVR